MTRSERLAEQLDWHWRTIPQPRLNGLTDEEYFWEPVRGCWSIRPRDTSATPLSEGSGEWTMDFASPAPVPAPVTTIAWRLAHIIVSWLGYRVGWYIGGQEIGSLRGGARAQTDHLAIPRRRWMPRLAGASRSDA